MKKTTVWVTRARSRFVCRRARITSIEAPVVPMKEARTAPVPRNVLFTAGVASRSPRSRIPPAIT